MFKTDFYQGLLAGVAATALTLGIASAAGATDKSGLYVAAFDMSDSYLVAVHDRSAQAAGAVVADDIAALSVGDEVWLRSFGLAGVMDREINVTVTLGSRVQERPRRVAPAIGDLIASIPARVRGGHSKSNATVSQESKIDDIATSAPEAEIGDPVGFAPLKLDVELYQSYLDDPSIEDADKRELIDVLWSIVVSFVDLGFGIHPAQQAQEHHDAGDEDFGDEIAEGLESSTSTMISSTHAENETKRAAAVASDREEARHDER